MRVKLSEEQIQRIIKEDLGVARAGLAYTNLFYSKVEPIVKDFLRNKKSQDIILKISPSEMSYVYQASMDDYIDLPIESMTILIKMKNYPRKKYTIPFSTGGAAESIQKEYKRSSFLKEPSFELPKYVLEEIDQVVVGKMEIEINITSSYEDSMEEDLLFDLRDTITHECNHIYEFYKRAESGAKQINVSLSYAGSKNFNVKREIFNVWEDFLNYVYDSEPYEVNAKVQEAFSLRSRMSLDEFMKTKYWKNATFLQTFDADTYFSNLVDTIQKYSPGKELSILNNLYKWFFTDYLKWMKFHGEKPQRFIEDSKHLYDLIKKFEPRINKAGDTLRRKYAKLYSIEPENNLS
jgi:hypothetical protein